MSSSLCLCAFVVGVLIPPAEQIKADRPRLLLRPGDTRLAVPLKDLSVLPRDDEFKAVQAALGRHTSLANLSMTYLLTGDAAAAENALDRMRAFTARPTSNPFTIYFTLMDLALAYDWLHAHPAFTAADRARLRAAVAPLVESGVRMSNDHIFHNYTLMSSAGLGLWALAVCGEDAASTRAFQAARTAYNDRLLPGMEYLRGAPAESPGYWTQFDLGSTALFLLACQSAFETDLFDRIRRDHHNWAEAGLEAVVYLTQPDLRFVNFGDNPSGPNGGATHEVAGYTDALTFATHSPVGGWFCARLKAKRGPARYHPTTAWMYFLYGRPTVQPAGPPPVARRFGNQSGGYAVMRSGWKDDDTLIAFRSWDHFGDHNHYDQGTFTIYKRGPLVVDAGRYGKTRGPQQETQAHNTLLVGGGQRPVRGQWFKTVAEFLKAKDAGLRLETGDLPHFETAAGWDVAVGSFGQAYTPEQAETVVRQLVFIRPNTLVVIDHVAAEKGRTLPQVEWLLHLPAEPTITGVTASGGNGQSGLVCRRLLPGEGGAMEAAPDLDGAWRVTTRLAAGMPDLSLVHIIQVGNGPEVPALPEPLTVERQAGALALRVGKRAISADTSMPWRVRVRSEAGAQE